MDDKKKTMQEEETKVTTTENSNVTDFEDLHKENVSKEPEKSKKEETKDQLSDKKEETRREDSQKDKKEEVGKEDLKKDKKEAEKEDTEKDEKGEAGKGNSEKDKEEAEKEDTEKDEKGEAGKEDSEKDKEEAEKEDTEKDEKGEAGKGDSEKDKEEAEKEDTEKDKKGEDKTKVSNNAISQSKRLAEAKASNNASQNKEVNDTKKSKNKKALWIALGSIAAVFVIAYFAGFIYFSGHFYQDVAVNGINVSGMDKTLAKQTLDDFYKNYILTIETIEEKQISIDGKDISMQISLHDDFNSCLKQQAAYLWFINMFEHHDFEVGADAAWDDVALSDIFDDMKILDKKLMVAPKDAYVGVEDGKFTIVKEVLGSTVDREKFEAAVNESLSDVMSTLVMVDMDCYDLPDVYADDKELKNELDAKNEYAKNEIKLQLDDLTLEPGMELYDKILEKKGDAYEISEKLVKKYVKSLADQYDTLGKDRTFTTSFNDKKVKVNGTAFGYEMNQEETEEALYKALTAGKPATVEAVFDSKGYTLNGENDIGDTYIEVNLSEQRVIAYKNGKKIAEDDCVSGKESTGHGTCIGLYAIQDKLSPTVLRGEKKPVTKTVTKKKKGKKVKVQETTYEYEYESPVTFWMQFNGGIGLHDAAGWRSTYGGSIYYYSGSHGCVNLPYNFAETLYNNFEIGDPVIVYFWDNENRK